MENLNMMPDGLSLTFKSPVFMEMFFIFLLVLIVFANRKSLPVSEKKLIQQKDKVSRLSVSELRSFKGLDHLTDEQANNAINTLEKYSILIIDLFKKQRALKNGNH